MNENKCIKLDVAVLGGGFAGVYCAKTLSEALKRNRDFKVGLRFTTWRRHEILRQFECFRRSPSVPIASRTEHPRFLRFEPSVESG